VETWMDLFEAVHGCKRCGLCRGRANAVPGEGNPRARLMLIGEGPGAQEDDQGRPFVGASGELLTRYLHQIGVERAQVYIANIVKCRPPGNRTPTPEEARACLPYLRAQFKLIRPKILVLLGATAARHTLGGEVRIRRDHGTWTQRKGIWMMPTFHPSALLRDPSERLAAWQDFLSIQAKLSQLEEA
jgi:uracil-DNA glycosylase family 4